MPFIKFRIMQLGAVYRVDYSKDGISWIPLDMTADLAEAKKMVLDDLSLLYDDRLIYETPPINTVSKTVH